MFMPTRFTMEGMIRKANKVLDRAAKTDRNGVMKKLFQQCKGIILISVVESAVVVSVSAGVGIMLVKDPDTPGKWNPPCACGMASTSWGISFGADMKDVIIFAMDDKSVRQFTSKVGLKLGLGTSVTLGTLGYNAGANVNLSGRGTNGSVNVHKLGVGGTVTIAFCKGAYVSASVSGAVVGPRDRVNRAFYEDQSLTASDILNGKVQVPEEKDDTILETVYCKLELLSCGDNEKVNPGAFQEASGTIPPAVANVLKNVTEEVIDRVQDNDRDEAARHCEVVVSVPCSSTDSEQNPQDAPVRLRSWWPRRSIEP